jgi:hypothetical protein
MPKRRGMPRHRRREALADSTIRQLLTAAGRERWPDGWAYIVDHNEGDGWVVFDVEEHDDGAWVYNQYKIGFTLTDTEPVGVTLVGEPEKVVANADYVVAEAKRVNATAHGRVLEAKGTAEDGTRVWRAVVIEAGESLNGRLYEAATLEKAATLYDGAKVYNRHRTLTDLQTSTTEGLVGYLRGPEFTGGAIEADLHLFASATGLAEALDASVEVAGAGLDPIVGLSHDVLATGVAVTVEGRQVDQIRSIEQVLSVDVVADPASGGRALRVVAGGIDPDTQPNPATSEEDITMERLKELMAKHLGGTITDEERGELATLLDDELGVDLEAITTPTAETETETEVADEKDPVAAGAVSEARRFEAASFEGQAIIRTALDGVPARMREAAEKLIPAKFTESDLRNILAPTQAIAAELEKQGLLEEGPSVGHVQVTKESHDKLVERLDATFAEKPGGFRSFSEMFAEFNDGDWRSTESTDFGYVMLSDLYGATRREGRVSEAVAASTFAQALGDSITRALVDAYSLPQLSNWEQVVSRQRNVNDFREQKRPRVGGYGTLPTVAESGSYNALTTPGDEEVTYSLTKKGGTEKVTYEAVMNDDIGVLAQIPTKLGRAAAQTLYRAVWNSIVTNPTIYDSTALFHASHGNLGSAALDAAALSAARTAMMTQTAYGDSSEVLGYLPQYLIVPAALRDTGFELTESAVAVTSGKDATVPNVNGGLNLITLPYLSDANNWFVVADPALCPTIEVGWLRGQRDPELFVQDMGNVGSVFATDEVTYKVRHIFGVSVLDYRGFYGAVVT